MNENDIKNLVFFKLLNKREMKLIIWMFSLSLFMLAVILVLGWLFPESPIANLIVIIVSVLLGLAIFIISIFWIIIKVKEFMVYNNFSEKFKSQNENLMIFLILSIFFEIIFVFVIKYSLPRDAAELKYGNESIKTLNHQYQNSKYTNSTNNTETTNTSSNNTNTVTNTTNTNTENNATTNTNTSTNNIKIFEELKMLKELLDDGTITEEEFKKKKESILNS
ncbi:MAG: SHOCT domain-containing protein [Metamycoplasmataceae bacterium]